MRAANSAKQCRANLNCDGVSMQDDWKTYAWLTLVALAASAFRWHELAYDAAGKFRWGIIVLQLPTAFAIGTVAHAATPAVLHFFPYAGSFLSEGLAGVFSFAGPLVVTRVVDAALMKFGGRA